MKILNKHILIKQMINQGNKYEDISKATGLSLGLISNVAKKKIEPKIYKVNKAVIWAAGWGSRMAPVTNKRPKPLIEVKGKILIESIVESLINSGIKDITIVIGKDHHAFKNIIDKYSLNFVINPTWQKHNNISSFYAVMKNINESCYFIDGDLLIDKGFRFANYFKNSFTYASWVENIKDIMIEKSGAWVSGYKKPNKFKEEIDGHQYKGIFGLNIDDLKILKNEINKVFSPLDEYNSLYWFDPLFDLCHKKAINMELELTKFNNILELDTLEDLIAVDPLAYKSKKYIKEKYGD